MKYAELVEIVNKQRKEFSTKLEQLDPLASLKLINEAEPTEEEKRLQSIELKLTSVAKNVAKNRYIILETLTSLEEQFKSHHAQNPKISYEDIIFNDLNDFLKNYPQDPNIFFNNLFSIDEPINPDIIKSIESFSKKTGFLEFLQYFIYKSLIYTHQFDEENKEIERIIKEELGDNPLDIFEPEALANIENSFDR